MIIYSVSKIRNGSRSTRVRALAKAGSMIARKKMMDKKAASDKNFFVSTFSLANQVEDEHTDFIRNQLEDF